jgi:hypothetical protein
MNCDTDTMIARVRTVEDRLRRMTGLDLRIWAVPDTLRWWVRWPSQGEDRFLQVDVPESESDITVLAVRLKLMS